MLPGRAFPLLLFALLAAAPTALAHTDLVDATPSPNTGVDVAPDEITLVFNEPLEDRYTSVSVTNLSGAAYATDTRVDSANRTRAIVTLAPLPDGVYAVRWRTLSVDTHTYQGAYWLGVNATPPSGPVPPDWGGSRAPALDHGHGMDIGSATEGLVRGIGFMGASIAAGIPLFLLLTRSVPLPAEARNRLWLLAAGSAAVAAAAGASAATAMSGRIATDTVDVFGTTSGAFIAWRIALLAGAAALLALARYAPREPVARAAGAAGLALALLALAATSFSGHAAALTTGRGLAIALDAAHLVAVAAWVGGVGALLTLLYGRLEPDAAARLVGRFTPLALASVLVIVATGLYATARQVGLPPLLTGSTYGVALGLKMLLLVPLVALGAYNAFVLRPRLANGGAPLTLRRLRALVTVEVLLMALALVAAGALANASPPATVAAPSLSFISPFVLPGSAIPAPLPTPLGLSEVLP